MRTSSITVGGKQFQVIPPRGGYRAGESTAGHVLCFKSYPRVGGILPKSHSSLDDMCFKSYPRVGGIFFGVSPVYLIGVSSHTPAWGVSLLPLPGCLSALFQVIPPRGGYRVIMERLSGDFVSSHTPAWGVSNFAGTPRRGEKFQVIPPRGGYPCMRISSRRICSFKSYPRVGGIMPWVINCKGE